MEKIKNLLKKWGVKFNENLSHEDEIIISKEQIDKLWLELNIEGEEIDDIYMNVVTVYVAGDKVDDLVITGIINLDVKTLEVTKRLQILDEDTEDLVYVSE